MNTMFVQSVPCTDATGVTEVLSSEPSVSAGALTPRFVLNVVPFVPVAEPTAVPLDQSGFTREEILDRTIQQCRAELRQIRSAKRKPAQPHATGAWELQ